MELADKASGGELLLFSQGRPEQGRLPGIGVDPGRHQVLLEPAVEVVADGDLALLAPLFPEPQDALGALVLEVAAAQPGEGADTGPGVGEGSQEGAVAEADDMGEVDGGEHPLSRACWMASWGVLPSTTACFRPRTEENGFRATAWRVTRASKK